MMKNDKLLFISGFWMLAIVIFLTTRDLFHFFPEINLTNESLSEHQLEMLGQVNVTGYFGKGAYFMYFTVQNNLLVSLGFLIASFIKDKILRTQILAILVSYITVVMFIFWTMISPYLVWFWLWFLITNVVYHAVIPLTSIIIWLIIKKERLEYKKWYICLIYPISYLILLLMLYYIPEERLGVYPMTNFDNPLFLNLNKTITIIINVAMVIALSFTFTMSYLLMIYSTRRKSKWKVKVI